MLGWLLSNLTAVYKVPGEKCPASLIKLLAGLHVMAGTMLVEVVVNSHVCSSRQSPGARARLWMGVAMMAAFPW